MKIGAYEFAENSRFQSGAVLNAGEVGKHLELLRQQAKGELTPKDVVDDARNHNSPLHSFFEWNDGDAAEQWRLQQARGLIRSVVAIYVDDTQPAVRTRAYVHINEPEAPHYRDASHAMTQKKTRDMVLQRAWRELQAWRKRYQDLKELAGVFTCIDEQEKRLPESISGK
jgi:hypothetical protein